jgi:hypothetical protein
MLGNRTKDKKRLYCASGVYFLGMRCNLRPILKNLVIFDASSHGQVEVLDWWKQIGLANEAPVARLISESLHQATMGGHLHVLDWWKNSGFKLHYDVSWIKEAASAESTAAFEWWIQSGLLDEENKRGLLKRAISKENVLVILWSISHAPEIMTSVNSDLEADRQEAFYRHAK